MHLVGLEMPIFEMDEHSHWKFKCVLVELFTSGGCKSILSDQFVIMVWLARFVTIYWFAWVTWRMSRRL